MKHTVTSTVQAAKEWQQQLRLPTTPSGGTCMTACTLYKSQKASSSLSRLTKKVTSEHALATRRVSKNLQQGRAGGEGSGHRGDNSRQKKRRDTVQPRSGVFLRKSFLRGQATRWVTIEANEQYKSIISALKTAAPEWEFEQINFVVGNRGSVVESDFYTKLKKLDIQERKKE